MPVKEIVDANVTFVSLVRKGANGKDFLIVKSDDEAPSIIKESPILKIDEEKHLVTGVVYEPDNIDSQGEFMSEPAIEKAAHNFLANYRNIDKSHTFQAENAEVVESYVAKSDHEIDGTSVKKGSWIMTTYIGDDAIWEQVKKGELNAYSMGGIGKRVEHPDMAPPVEKSSDDNEVRGFFTVVKDFFTGATKLEKNYDGTIDAKKPTDFASMVTGNKVDENLSTARWALSDVMRNILTDATITDKATVISGQIDAFKSYVLGQLNALGIEKAAELLAEPIEKSGRKISTERLSHIKAAHAALQNILSEVEASEEGEGEMKKEDVEAIVKEALAPVTEKLEKLEKEDPTPEGAPASGDAPAEITPEIIKAAVEEAVKPLGERLDTLEKSRGIKKSDDAGEEGEVKKEAPHYLAGIL